MPASTDRFWLPLLLLCAAQAAAQADAPLLEAVESSDAGRHVNVFVQFSCSVRYLGHMPRDAGASVTVRLRLGPDCAAGGGSPMTELPRGAGGSTVVRGVRLERTLPGEAQLAIEWSGIHPFLVQPTSDSRGVRLRILDVFAAARATVTLAPVDELTSGYSVNLESSTTPFTPQAVEAASRILKAQVHVSTVELAGETWHRLRAGPFSARVDAQRLLAVARQHYPRAWLGVADEPAAPEVLLPPGDELAPARVTDPPLPPGELDDLMKQARRASAKRDYARAVELLTKLTRQPEFAGRAQAQELLGLTRERSGQLAHAKAEYEEYLRRYPDGNAARRVRSRLRALSSAHRVGRSGVGAGGGALEAPWRVDGGAAQLYRWERSQLDTARQSSERQEQNALYTDADFIARRRGERFDFVSRIYAGYAYDLLTAGPGDRARMSAAFVEFNDRTLGVAARMGRQTRNSGGLLGTFDGLFSSYQLNPAVALNLAAGFPVESSTDGLQTDRRFVGFSAEFGPFHEAVDFGAFAVLQEVSGVTDRRSVGVEARYFVAGRTLLGMLDYDVYYQELNSAFLTGSLQLPARWSLSFSADHRRSPVLTTRNALIGQPVRDLDELLTLFTPAEVEELARDRTPVSNLFSLSLSRPLGERFQVDFEAYGSRLEATEASGNVAATPASGLEKTFQVQLSGTNLARANDLWSLTLRRQDASFAALDSALLAARLPVGGAWRFGPRVRVERREATLDGSREMLYVPMLRLDYQRGRAWFECEMAAEFGDRQLASAAESRRRYYFGVGYRLSF